LGDLLLERQYAHGTDTVCAVAQEQAQIVIPLDVRSAGLLLSQPPFRPDMLEEGMQAIGPIMLSADDGKAACDVLAPLVPVGKARSAGNCLNESSGSSPLVQDLCTAQLISYGFLSPLPEHTARHLSRHSLLMSQHGAKSKL
jgi:hypothetical protein